MLSDITSSPLVDDPDEEEKVVELDDVSRAFFEAAATRDVCVELPAEAMNKDEQGAGMVGHLQMSLYGTRDAANNWQEEIAKFMRSAGFARGRYNPSGKDSVLLSTTRARAGS